MTAWPVDDGDGLTKRTTKSSVPGSRSCDHRPMTAFTFSRPTAAAREDGAIFCVRASSPCCLHFAQVVLETVEALLPEAAIALEPVGDALERAASIRQGRHCASRPRAMRPARSSTLRCLEMAGRLISNGSASSVTEVSPTASRARMARRVGSASAAKVVLRRPRGRQ